MRGRQAREAQQPPSKAGRRHLVNECLQCVAVVLVAQRVQRRQAALRVAQPPQLRIESPRGDCCAGDAVQERHLRLRIPADARKICQTVSTDTARALSSQKVW